MPDSPTVRPPVPADVLHSENHSHLSPEEIAKARARHQREHPNQNVTPAAKPQKTPRR